MAFFEKADAKVRLIFELPKLFEVFLKKVFFQIGKVQILIFVFTISSLLRFSLESGCKITALQHILQTYHALFYHFPATFILTR